MQHLLRPWRTSRDTWRQEEGRGENGMGAQTAAGADKPLRGLQPNDIALCEPAPRSAARDWMRWLTAKS